MKCDINKWRDTMIYTKLTKKALKLCFEKHKDQVDKTGLPYVFHPFHLAEQMDDEVSTICALLHDVVEDTNTTFEDLENLGFPKEVIDVLKLLTHSENVPYMDYVKNLSQNKTAVKVKMADLKHNSDLTRLDVIDEYAVKRSEKYKEALAYLENLK